MARYSPSPVPTTDLDNTQRWLREEMEQVRNSSDDIYLLSGHVATEYIRAGYGQIDRVTPLPIGTINSTWQVLTWEEADIANPKGVTYNLPLNLTIDHTGVWSITVSLSLTFDEVNAGRQMQVRLYNVDAAEGDDAIDYYVGRNQGGLTLTATFLARVVIPSQNYIVEIRSPLDTFANATFTSGHWGVHHVSEYDGTFFQDLESADRTRST